MSKLTIKQIRDTIQMYSWSRNDLTGGTREEFQRQRVGEILGNHVKDLLTLDIPARFARDIEARDWEIEACKRVIARWESQQLKMVA